MRVSYITVRGRHSRTLWRRRGESVRAMTMMGQATRGSAGPLAGMRVSDCTHVIAGACARCPRRPRRRRHQDRTAAGRSDPHGIGPSAPTTSSIGTASYRRRHDAAPGRGAVRRCGWADVWVENFRPGASTAGSGYAACRGESVAHLLLISGFGQAGPYRDRGGLDLVAQQ